MEGLLNAVLPSRVLIDRLMHNYVLDTILDIPQTSHEAEKELVNEFFFPAITLACICCKVSIFIGSQKSSSGKRGNLRLDRLSDISLHASGSFSVSGGYIFKGISSKGAEGAVTSLVSVVRVFLDLCYYLFDCNNICWYNQVIHYGALLSEKQIDIEEEL